MGAAEEFEDEFEEGRPRADATKVRNKILMAGGVLLKCPLQVGQTGFADTMSLYVLRLKLCPQGDVTGSVSAS